jgi:uncharacterized protein (UPF0335 family)
MTSNSNAVLKGLIERIERLEVEKQVIADDQKQVFAEGKAAGFDVKIMRKVIALRKLSKDERDKQRSLIDLYMDACGGGLA